MASLLPETSISESNHHQALVMSLLEESFLQVEDYNDEERLRNVIESLEAEINVVSDMMVEDQSSSSSEGDENDCLYALELSLDDYELYEKFDWVDGMEAQASIMKNDDDDDDDSDVNMFSRLESNMQSYEDVMMIVDEFGGYGIHQTLDGDHGYDSSLWQDTVSM